MSVSYPPPPPAPRRQGWGCLGIGCLVVALIVLVFLGLGAAGGYMLYRQAITVTSTVAGDVPAFTGSDDVVQSARQKVQALAQSLEHGQPGSLQLSGDEINSLIASDPDFAKNNVKAYVTLTGDHGRLQTSVPTELVTKGLIAGRYINIDATLTVSFDSDTHSIIFTPQVLQLGNQPFIGPDLEKQGNSFAAGFNRGFAPSFTTSFNQSFNNGIRQNPGGRLLLDHAKTVEIKDGMLDIETQ
jgi:hypothetical protein